MESICEDCSMNIDDIMAMSTKVHGPSIVGLINLLDDTSTKLPWLLSITTNLYADGGG